MAAAAIDASNSRRIRFVSESFTGHEHEE